jgi:pimeloyl-ACP methyl ester carboxylesterase
LPSSQAALIHQALASLGVKRPIVLGHSWSGALATAYALAYPNEVRGLVLLAPVTHPWPGGIGWINDVAALPVIGQLIAHTLILPAGYFMLKPGVAGVFRPDTPPPEYATRTGVAMLLRPNEFIANAQDLSSLKEFVRAQAPRYGEIKVPVAIVAGDKDPVVYTDIHSRAIAKQLPHATLTVLPGTGHMVQYVAADRVVAAIDDVAAKAR